MFYTHVCTDVYGCPLSHLVRVLDVTVGEVGRAPAAHLVADVHAGRHEDREDDEDVDSEAAVEPVAETVTAASTGVIDVTKRQQQPVHFRCFVSMCIC